MNDQSLFDRFAPLWVALLLIVTAWGNAVAMFAIGVVGLVVSLLLHRRSAAQGAAPASTLLHVTVVVALATATIIAVILWFWPG